VPATGSALAAAVPAKANAQQDPREALLSETVLRLLEQDHLLHEKIDGKLSREAFDAYLDRLDATKMFLLQSDRDALAKYAGQVGDEMRAGSLDLAHEGERVFVQRAEDVQKMVADLLSKPMNHGDEEFVETDPKKLNPAATEDELRERWRKRLELEVLDRMYQMQSRLDAQAKEKAKAHKTKTAKAGAQGSDAAGSGSGSNEDPDDVMPIADIPTTEEGREAKARDELAKMYAARFVRLEHPEKLDPASDLLNAVCSTLDPHTDYLPPADKANFDIQMSGSLEGIGAALREHDHYIEVVDIIPGGAAWRQGKLQPGDMILAVQDEGKEPVDVVDMRIDDVVKMIRGKKGTKVRLKVQKKVGRAQTIALTRDVVVIEESYARGAILKPKHGPALGYNHLPALYGSQDGRTASADVKRLLDEMSKQKVAGVVLDIRSNGGGLLGDAVKLTGEFIDKGPVVQVQDSDKHREVMKDKVAGTDYDGPVVVMVDRFSASASEILAGALQDYHRAVIVGSGGTTHGKGTVQTLADLDRITGSGDDLGVLKLTIEQFFRVTGSSTQLKGVTPDIVLPDPEGYLDTGEAKLDHPIAWSSIDPAQYTPWKATWNVADLIKRSAARVARNPLFAKIDESDKILRAQREDTKMPLQESAYDAREKSLKDALEAATPDLTHARPYFAVDEIADPEAPQAIRDGKPVDRDAKWREALSHDPWVEESLSVLGDMAAKR
jgi:carboxyl-terminal processing protease